MEEAQRFTNEVAAQMTCRFENADNERRPPAKRVIRYCEPGDPSRVIVEIVEESTQLSASVFELDQDGRVRPAVQAFAHELEARFEARFGRERITIKRMNWRV